MKILHGLYNLIFNHHNYAANLSALTILPVAGGRIEYCSFGSGPPLILVMGYAATLNSWDSRFLTELAKSYQVIVYNNRNLGNSLFAAAEYSISDMANDVELLRVGLKLDKIALAGLSMGGVIAQKYAYLFPDKLSQLILINTLPPGILMHKPPLAVENVLRDLESGSWLNSWRLTKLLLPSIWQLPGLWLNHFKPRASNKEVPSTTIAEQQRVLEGWSNWQHPETLLKIITTPTLILLGLADRLVPPQNSRVLKHYLKNSELVEYKDGGHIMIFEYPFALAQTIHQFIQSTDQPAANKVASEQPVAC